MGLLSLSLFLALFLITLSFPFLCLTQFLSICSVSVLFAIYRHLPGSFFSVSVMVCLSLSLFLFSATLSGSVSVGLCVSNPPSPPNYPRPPKGNLTLGPPAPPRHPGLCCGVEHTPSWFCGSQVGTLEQQSNQGLGVPCSAGSRSWKSSSSRWGNRWQPRAGG